MPKPPGKCIFCGGTPLDKEHIFATWVRELFPREPEEGHTVGVIRWDTGEPELKKTTRQGYPGVKTARVTCKKCNSGWINHIDDAAKYVATPIIKEEKKTVLPEMQKVLATWLSKVSMVADSVQKDVAVVPQCQRDWMKEKSEPPPLWAVWVGTYQGNAKNSLGLYQHGGALFLKPKGRPELACHINTTTLNIGPLFAFVTSSDSRHASLYIGHAAKVLKRIWPLGDTFDWPVRPPIFDLDVSAMASLLRSVTQNWKPEHPE